METNIRMGARDFFLHVAAIASLYVGTVALLNLLFRVINIAFSQVDSFRDYYYYHQDPPVSLLVATLMVVFPLFLVLTNILRRGYAEEPQRKEFAVRKWLIYITLFIAGGVLAGDLITLIYFFLDGREITTVFLLKVLIVLVVTGGIFGYYLDDLKDRLTGGRRNLWRIGALVLTVGSIIAGFAVIGSPASQRAYRYDAQRVNDLQNIQWQIMNYWQQKQSVPNSLEDLNDSLSDWRTPVDPKNSATYEYEKTGSLSFRLCANFQKEPPKNEGGAPSGPRMMMDSIAIKSQDNWDHGVGRTCFDRTIDPDLYPPRTR